MFQLSQKQLFPNWRTNGRWHFQLPFLSTRLFKIHPQDYFQEGAK